MSFNFVILSSLFSCQRKITLTLDTVRDTINLNNSQAFIKGLKRGFSPYEMIKGHHHETVTEKLFIVFIKGS